LGFGSVISWLWHKLKAWAWLELKTWVCHGSKPRLWIRLLAYEYFGMGWMLDPDCVRQLGSDMVLMLDPDLQLQLGSAIGWRLGFRSVIAWLWHRLKLDHDLSSQLGSAMSWNLDFELTAWLWHGFKA
jgi:hypothetical protein